MRFLVIPSVSFSHLLLINVVFIIFWIRPLSMSRELLVVTAVYHSASKANWVPAQAQRQWNGGQYLMGTAPFRSSASKSFKTATILQTSRMMEQAKPSNRLTSLQTLPSSSAAEALPVLCVTSAPTWLMKRLRKICWFSTKSWCTFCCL